MRNATTLTVYAILNALKETSKTVMTIDYHLFSTKGELSPEAKAEVDRALEKERQTIDTLKMELASALAYNKRGLSKNDEELIKDVINVFVYAVCDHGEL